MTENMFTPVEWAHTTNIYEVNVRQYTPEGTFNAFATHLPRLRDMGIEILWFMPITPIASINRKGTLGSYYACSDYTSINPEFGTLDDFKSLVNNAHEIGFKVIIDWVANHTGYGHTWTKKHPEFYNKNQYGQFYDSNGWDDVIGLNYNNPSLWFAMIDAMRFWIDTCGIDGFRCDMAHLVPLEFWRNARTQLDKIRKLFWLAETENVDYHQVFDATYAWKWLHTMEAYAQQKIGLYGLDEVLTDYNNRFPATALRSLFTSNHDENSHSGSEYERMKQYALPFAVFCCTWNGVPLIYSGQEAANKKRLAFFEHDPIDLSGGFPLHDFYKTLLQLRNSNPALRSADDASTTSRVTHNIPAGIFAFVRKKEEDAVIVLLNLGNENAAFRLSDELVKGTYEDVFNRQSYDCNNHPLIQINAGGYMVLQRLIA
jgi:alpha-amylase